MILGGEVGSDQDAAFERWRAALACPTVQGSWSADPCCTHRTTTWRARSTPRSASSSAPEPEENDGR